MGPPIKAMGPAIEMSLQFGISPTSGAAFPMFTGPIAFPYFLRDSMGGMVWVAGGPRSLGVPGISLESVEGHLIRFLSTRRRLLWLVVDQGSQANSSLVST